MSQKSVRLVGGPDSGKTNYVGRLWISLKERKGALQRAGMPTDITYIEAICAHILKGEFAGRTDRNMERQNFSVPLKSDDDGQTANLMVPDFTGELWLNAVVNSELPKDWLDELEKADSALLFVRVLSPLNVQPLDWVATRDILRLAGDGNEDGKLPTQVVLCELLRLLENRLKPRPGGGKPRVAVVVTAFDLLDQESRQAGPSAYLKHQFPLFAGALEDLECADARIFGVSIVDGDPERDDAFKQRILGMNMSEIGSVIFENADGVDTDADVTLPVAWAIGD